MRNTIEARDGYQVKKVMNIITGEVGYRVDDGCDPIMVAQRRKVNEMLDELANNEAAKICEVFTTEKGNQFIYWRDDEANVDFITQVPNEGLFSV